MELQESAKSTLRNRLNQALDNGNYDEANKALEDLKAQEDAKEVTEIDGVAINMGAKALGVVDQQDKWQKIFMAMNFSLEIYKVVMACCLVIFSEFECAEYETFNGTNTDSWAYSSTTGGEWYSDPRWKSQKIGSWACSEAENWDFFFTSKYALPIASLWLNIGCVILFLVFYGVEATREIRAIDWLDVNKEKPLDDESCAAAFMELDGDKMTELKRLDWWYKALGILVMIAYPVNMFVSLIMLSWYAYEPLMSALLFSMQVSLILNKLNRIKMTSTQPQHTFLSAYLSTRVQWNDVDRTDESSED